MRIRKQLVVSGIALLLGLVACASGGSGAIEVKSGLVIHNVTVVNTRDGSSAANMNVLIEGGKIRKITERPVALTGTAQSIDGNGKYLVPGFLDMHTHAAGSLGLPPTDFPVLLANGITGIREAGGTPALISTLRAQNLGVIAGTVDAPEVLMMPSAIFAGQAPTDAGARQFVRDRLAEGADFIKVAGGSPLSFLAVIDEARKQGKHAAGHMTNAVSAADSSNAGYHSFEHLGAGLGLMIDCSSDEAALRAAVLANPVPPPANVVNPRLFDGNQYAPYYQRILDTYSEAKCRALAQTFVKNDSWQTVTLIRLRTADFGTAALYRNDPNLAYVDKTRRALWESVAQQVETTLKPATLDTLQKFYALQLKVVKVFAQNGVKITAGSDLGGGFVIPGFSLHQEFKELAAAGLTPLQVLQATTLNGAQFAGREASIGTVEEGKNADLVLLDANPLADVANLDRISAVFNKGRYYSRSALDKLLSDVAAAYRALPLQALHTALDPSHID